MSSPAAALGVQDARQKVLTTDFFALCYLMLSNLAYTAGNDATQAIDQIKRLLPAMPFPQGTVKGEWSVAWGPQVPSDGSNSNLMYAAQCSDSVSGLPVFLAVAIRGTDTQAKPSGVLKQIIEDTDAEHQVIFPVDNQVGSKIARGTEVGLDALNKLIDPQTKQSLADYLQGFVSANPDVPIVITGHSLGGCQVTVLALDLAGKLPKTTKIVPNTFAAPTAGNQAFVRLYEQAFPQCPRWFNTLDLVPRAYAGLDEIRTLWSACQRPAPLLVKIALEGLILSLEIAKVDYVQQFAESSRPLAGACQMNQPDAMPPDKMKQAVAEIQTMLQNQMEKILHAGRLANVLNRLEGNVGHLLGDVATHLLPVEKLAERIIGHFSVDELAIWVQELLFQHSLLTGYWNAVKSSNGVAPISDPFAKAAGA
jgi:pimeloyl-ACP methyl ester carboxylesterase